MSKKPFTTNATDAEGIARDWAAHCAEVNAPPPLIGQTEGAAALLADARKVGLSVEPDAPRPSAAALWPGRSEGATALLADARKAGIAVHDDLTRRAQAARPRAHRTEAQTEGAKALLADARMVGLNVHRDTAEASAERLWPQASEGAREILAAGRAAGFEVNDALQRTAARA